MVTSIVQKTLQDTKYDSGIFSQQEILALEQKINIQLIRKKETPCIKCIIREKDIQLKPEEVIRQLYIARLIAEYGYTKNRIALEHSVTFGREKKKADIVIFDKDRPETPYIIKKCRKTRSFRYGI